MVCWRERNMDTSACFPLGILKHTEQDSRKEPIPGNRIVLPSHCFAMLEVLGLGLSPLLRSDL